MINPKSTECRVWFLLFIVTFGILGLYCACKTYWGARTAGVGRRKVLTFNIYTCNSFFTENRLFVVLHHETNFSSKCISFL